MWYLNITIANTLVLIMAHPGHQGPNHWASAKHFFLSSVIKHNIQYWYFSLSLQWAGIPDLRWLLQQASLCKRLIVRLLCGQCDTRQRDPCHKFLVICGDVAGLQVSFVCIIKIEFGITGFSGADSCPGRHGWCWPRRKNMLGILACILVWNAVLPSVSEDALWHCIWNELSQCSSLMWIILCVQFPSACGTIWPGQCLASWVTDQVPPQVRGYCWWWTPGKMFMTSGMTLLYSQIGGRSLTSVWTTRVKSISLSSMQIHTVTGQ